MNLLLLEILADMNSLMSSRDFQTVSSPSPWPPRNLGIFCFPPSSLCDQKIPYHCSLGNLKFPHYSPGSIWDLHLASFHFPPSNLKAHFYSPGSLWDLHMISLSPPHHWDSSQLLVHRCESVPPLVHWCFQHSSTTFSLAFVVLLPKFSLLDTSPSSSWAIHTPNVSFHPVVFEMQAAPSFLLSQWAPDPSLDFFPSWQLLFNHTHGLQYPFPPSTFLLGKSMDHSTSDSISILFYNSPGCLNFCCCCARVTTFSQSVNTPAFLSPAVYWQIWTSDII